MRILFLMMFRLRLLRRSQHTCAKNDASYAFFYLNSGVASFILTPMTRQLNRAAVLKWKFRMGGLRQATILISESLECSISKAQKIASGRYPSVPNTAEQKVLAELMGLSREKLFPAASRSAS